MTDRLRLYNAALRICGHSAISSLSEETESRRLLDGVWDDGGVRACLERGLWIFARRSVQLDADPSVVVSFGYQHAFEKATDWVTTSGIYSDEGMKSPLLNYSDEAGYLFADFTPIYVQYISDHASFGGDLSRWPETFKDYVAAFFASKIIHRLTSDKERILFLFGADGRGERTGLLASSLKTAKSKDAFQGPTKFLPPGSWVLSRGRGSDDDGGSKSSLIG